MTTEGGQSADPEFHAGPPRSEEETSMETVLLHNGRIAFYLLFVAALLVAYIWDYLRYRGATDDDSRRPANHGAYGLPGFLPCVARHISPRSVSRPFQRTDMDKEAEPIRGGHRPQAPTDPAAARSSRNGRP